MIGTSAPYAAPAAGPPATAPPLIRLRDVARRYLLGPITVTALEDVSLDVDAGEFVVVLGPSGNGKTTLLNLIGALDTPTEGRIVIAGEDITAASRRELFRFRRHGVSFIFQSFNLFPALTARENVEFGADVADRRDGRRRAIAMLERVGLAERVDHFPHELSGGEQQRVAIARARDRQPRPAGGRADRGARLPHGRADPGAPARADARGRHRGDRRHPQPRRHPPQPHPRLRLHGPGASGAPGPRRRREYATMFAYGVPLRTVVRNAMIEGGAAGVLATLAGVGAGIVVIGYIVNVTTPRVAPDLGAAIAVRPGTLAVAAVLGVVATALAPLLTARRLARMDIPSTLRVVE